MFKTISRNIFVLFVFSFALSAIDISAQNRADEPSVGGSSKKAGKTRTYKKARVLQNSTMYPTSLPWLTLSIRLGF